MMKFTSGVIPPNTDQSAYWFLFHGNQLLVHVADHNVSIPITAELQQWDLQLKDTHYFGSIDNHSCYIAEIPETFTIPAGYELRGLRQMFGELDEDLFWVAGRASQILHWDRTSRYCGRCGSPTERKADERAKQCPACGLLIFPRISPAVIVAITKGDQILLATNANFPGRFYSVLAGFVEPGENLEDCVRREVMEEVGIELKNIRYFGSQPWPFPDSLMVGFTAEYASGEICIDPKELSHADWFAADQLPNIPGKISIARRLIDWFREEYVKEA